MKLTYLFCLIVFAIVTTGCGKMWNPADDYPNTSAWDLQFYRPWEIPKGAPLLVGDSITVRMKTFPGVYNVGVSGNTSQMLLVRLKDLLPRKPSKIFLLIGINNLNFGQTVAETEAGISDVLAEITAMSPTTQVYVETLIPNKDPTKHADIGLINTWIRALTGVQIIDLNAAFGPYSDSLFDDGLHPNNAGVDLIRNTLVNYL